MICPHCQTPNNSRVIDSEPVRGEVKRRRECQSCGRRFTTYEAVGEKQAGKPAGPQQDSPRGR